eukprot:m.173862 g.173862  ORF g.173862 m.173862 type:complete len:199 (-) comp17322_c0_seq10:2066-2662(-)
MEVTTEAGEQALLRAEVRLSERLGMLHLTSQRLVFLPQNRAAQMTVRISDILKLRGNKEDSAKVKLQLILASGDSPVFVFTSNNAPLERNRMRDRISTLMQLQQMQRSADVSISMDDSMMRPTDGNRSLPAVGAATSTSTTEPTLLRALTKALRAISQGRVGQSHAKLYLLVMHALLALLVLRQMFSAPCVALPAPPE